MDKEQMQDRELTKVGGGDDYFHADNMDRCTSCGNIYKLTAQYPTGFFLKEESDGCGSTRYYKCPHCGYEWTI